MNCPNCGTALAPGSGFCGACGTRLQAQQPQGFAPGQTPAGGMPGYPQQQAGYPQQQGQQPYPQQPGYPQQGQPQGFQQTGQPQGFQQPGQPQGFQQPGYPPPGQPQGYPPPGQPQGYPPPGQPGPQGYPPPGQYPQPGGPMDGYAQGAPPQHAAPQQGYGAPTLRPFPIVMNRGLTRLTGQFFLAPTRIFFLCESQKGGFAVALGTGLGGLVGGAIAALAAPTPGQAPVIDEPTLFQAVQQMPGSMVMEPPQFKSIKYTMWTRGIFYGGNTYALRDGLSKDLRQELGLWCQANNVMAKGLLK